MLGRTNAETRKQRTLHRCLKHFAFKFEIDRSFPKNHPTCATRSKPCSRSTCCRSISPSSLSSQSGTPDLLHRFCSDKVCAMPKTAIALSICSFSKALSPTNVNISSATRSFVEVGRASLHAGGRPHLVRCARFSFGANHRLAIVVLLGLARNCFTSPASFPACCSFGRVSSSSSIPVPAHESSSPSMSSCSSLHSFPVSKTFSPLLDSPPSRLGPAGFEFPRGPARSQQGQHREGNLLSVVATLRFA